MLRALGDEATRRGLAPRLTSFLRVAPAEIRQEWRNVLVDLAGRDQRRWPVAAFWWRDISVGARRCHRADMVKTRGFGLEIKADGRPAASPRDQRDGPTGQLNARELRPQGILRPLPRKVPRRDRRSPAGRAAA